MSWMRWRIRKWSRWHRVAGGKARCGLNVPTVPRRTHGESIQTATPETRFNINSKCRVCGD